MSAGRKRVRMGDMLFAEGDLPTTAWLIEVGRIELSAWIGGKRQVLGELGSGNLLGESAVLDDSVRTVSARALSDCVLTPINREQFLERLAAADPIVRALLMSQISHYRGALDALMRDQSVGKPGIPAAISTVAPLPDADIAMIRSDSAAMALGDNGPSNSGAFNKIRLESELRSALDRNELDVRLQPIEEIATGKIAGYEALIRWHHDVRGAISPDEFIRLAEETSLILPVADYVLERVCDMLLELRWRGSEPLPFISLNVSARQLNDITLVERIQRQLRARELPERCLGIEITESLMLDQAQVARLLDQCHGAGIAVSLDDFGSGYANLALLSTLRFDHIKLDRSFMPTLARPRGAALVGAMVAMTSALGSDVIVEGVETAEQHAFLARLGCRYAQGWLIGRAQSLDDVLAARSVNKAAAG